MKLLFPLFLTFLISCNGTTTKTEIVAKPKLALSDSISIIIIKGDSNLPVRSLALSYVTPNQLNQVKADLIKAYTAANVLQDTKIATLSTQASLNVLSKTVSALQLQQKNYAIDSAAVRKRLMDAEKHLAISDSLFKNLGDAYLSMSAQNHEFYIRTDTINKKLNTTLRQLDSLITTTNRQIVFPDSSQLSIQSNRLTITKWNALIDQLKKLGVTL